MTLPYTGNDTYVEAHKKQSPLPTAEDKKFLWYHLSSPPRRPHGILTIRKLYRAFPVPAYCQFSQATPKGIPHHRTHCLAPSGSSLGGHPWCVLVFFTVLCIYVFLFP